MHNAILPSTKELLKGILSLIAFKIKAAVPNVKDTDSEGRDPLPYFLKERDEKNTEDSQRRWKMRGFHVNSGR